MQHFYVTPGHYVKDFSIKGIVKLTKPPEEEKARDKTRTEFEGYWQTRLMTLEPYGLNGKDEWAITRNNKQRKVFLGIETIRKIFIYHYNVMECPICITTFQFNSHLFLPNFRHTRGEVLLIACIAIGNSSGNTDGIVS